MKKICTRPEWSNENNDACPCDDPEMFADLYEGSCEGCSWWEEEHPWS